MMGIPYICLYTSYLTSLAPYTDSQLGRLVRAMLTYRTAGEVPEFQGSERYIWPMLKDQLDRDRENYRKRREKNRANGAKGGRPKKASVPSETEGVSGEPKKAKENEKENGKKMERRFFGGQAPRGCMISSQNADTSPAPYRNRPSSDSGNRVFPMGLRKSAVCGILTEAKHGSVFPGCLTNWNLIDN